MSGKTHIVKVKTKADKEYQTFVRESAVLIDLFSRLIQRVPQKGDKMEDCQHLTLLNALNQLEMTVNGTTKDDFVEVNA